MSKFLVIASAAMLLGLSAVGCSTCPCNAGGQGDALRVIDGHKVYDVAYVPNAGIKVDGELNDAAWAKAQALTDFCMPWENGPAPRMEFKALCDDENLYFAFRVYGPYEPAGKWESKTSANEEDRFELYLSCDDAMKEYYGIEIDSVGRVLDYKAAHYRQLDSTWSCPGLKTAGKPGKDGYVVEGSIPLATLAALRMPLRKDGDKVLAALMRTQAVRGDDGRVHYHFPSWVNPHVERPDFHVPGMLGYLRLRK